MEEKDYLLFENYLSGDLNLEEKQQFEKLLTEDASVNRAFEAYKEIASHLEQSISNEAQSRVFKENLQGISEDYFNAEHTETKIRKLKPWNLAIAASIVFLLGFFIFNPFSTPTYSDYNDFGTISLTERGDNQELFKSAEDAFNSQNYEAAELFFNKILALKTNTEIELYKSICLIETNQFGEADELLFGITEGNSIYESEAKWYLALSKLKQNQHEECLEILKTISKESEYYNEAQKLIKRLD